MQLLDNFTKIWYFSISYLEQHIILHCPKVIQIRSLFCSVFSRIWTEYGPGKSSYLDFFHALLIISESKKFYSRSSRSEVLCKTVVLRHFAKFTGKHLNGSLLFNIVEGVRSVAILRNILRHRCFPVSFAEFLRTPLFTEQLQLLLLPFYW